MNTIRVSASRPYDVLVGRGLLEKTGGLAAGIVAPCKAAVISDDTVFRLHGLSAVRSLEAAGFSVTALTFPAGEASKNLATYGRILNHLAADHFTRSDLIVALGGGVTGDLAGFVAATYLRGVSYIQIPTTLLAAVDSSVGGKTAVDLDAGKNLVGAFYQPSLVICDPDTLSTLPREVFRDGCAEVIKYGVLGNRTFFEELETTPAEEQLEHVISVCVEMKRDVVQADEFDRGERQKLNLGHSFGHAIEKISAFTVSHGSAVAMGMAMIARAAENLGFCAPAEAERITALLARYGLPTEIPYGAEDLYQAARSDKKIGANAIQLVVPDGIGRCHLEKVPVADLPRWLAAGGAK